MHKMQENQPVDANETTAFGLRMAGQASNRDTRTARRAALRVLATTTACTLAGLSGVFGVGGMPVAVAHASGGDGDGAKLADLGACVSDKGKLDVILLMDETESLIHHVENGVINPNLPGSDADHNRVLAAQGFVDELLAKQKDEGFEARIKLAGFGQEYHSTEQNPEAYGDWTKLDESGAKTMKKLIEGEKDRTSELYTNYANALDGAYQDFARAGTPDSCKLLITFTDGSLTAAGGWGAAGQAQQEICKPDGIADRYRASGITNIGIGLSDPKNPSDFSLYKSITEADGGIACGEKAPNGAFFPADGVGSLFGSFHKVLSTGGDFSKETKAQEGFEFMLDKSVDSVRFTALAQDDLGPDAVLELVSPAGKTLDLKGSGSGSVGGADVTWVGSADPVQKFDGEMRLTDAEDWDGKWTLRFKGFAEDQRDGRVFNTVKIQPDLQVQIAAKGKDAHATEHGLVVRSDDELQVSLVGRDGKPRTMEGDAKVAVHYTPNGGKPQELLADAPIGTGDAVTIPLDGLKELPTAGQIDASVAVTTKGSDDVEGTQLEPVVGRTDLSVALANMPQVPGSFSLNMNDPKTTIDIPVTGPGKVWVDKDATIKPELLPEGVRQIELSSKYDSVDNALELQDGEEATIPVTLSVEDLKDGMVAGTLPLNMAKLDGSNTQLVSLPINGSMSVPTNKITFTVALLAALLLALAIPLGLTYLVRYLTAKIPAQYYGGVRIPLTMTGNTVRYDGNKRLTLSIDEAARNQIPRGDQRRAVVRGFPLEVRSFQVNPLAAPFVKVGTAPSVAGSGAQVDGHAELPLAVQGSWFIVGNPKNANQLDLVVMPRLPMDEDSVEELQSDIEQRAPELIRVIRRQIEAAAVAEDTAEPVAATEKTAAADNADDAPFATIDAADTTSAIAAAEGIEPQAPAKDGQEFGNQDDAWDPDKPWDPYADDGQNFGTGLRFGPSENEAPIWDDDGWGDDPNKK